MLTSRYSTLSIYPRTTFGIRGTVTARPIDGRTAAVCVRRPSWRANVLAEASEVWAHSFAAR